MEKVFRIFDSHNDADCEEKKYYLGLSPNQRVEILLQLVSNYSDTYNNGTTARLQRIYRIIDREQC